MAYKRFKISRQLDNDEKPLMATALQYDPERGGAPRVVASGQRKVAEQILAEAKKHNISIYEDAALTAALSNVNLGEEIPEELYRVVAEVLAYIYRVADKYKK
ncbi:EscU/YscU/HrcU family type III secretion system export apparatus switch protein [Candidatus Villigracilis saccharophilus]|uniref:EscU/YscU/HrcU family type III secretion system export apparatus switch protein n=1 Tax=Candidatus Villigracilis saccharophilus TaxID=3140684 RepID=UPI0031E6823B